MHFHVWYIFDIGPAWSAVSKNTFVGVQSNFLFTCRYVKRTYMSQNGLDDIAKFECDWICKELNCRITEFIDGNQIKFSSKNVFNSYYSIKIDENKHNKQTKGIGVTVIAQVSDPYDSTGMGISFGSSREVACCANYCSNNRKVANLGQ
ncbi:hypothetical protein GQR58_007082 [Nymphon striatum]|nr:hypothetical protein GQR58_007082 [Nymphon striatum]